jgi:hypothetical protein
MKAPAASRPSLSSKRRSWRSRSAALSEQPSQSFTIGGIAKRHAGRFLHASVSDALFSRVLGAGMAELQSAAEAPGTAIVMHHLDVGWQARQDGPAVKKVPFSQSLDRILRQCVLKRLLALPNRSILVRVCRSACALALPKPTSRWNSVRTPAACQRL